jgi:hypothetical protein
MPKGVYERKPKESDMSPPAANTEVKMFPVVLNKNYVPRGDYEIVGYLKEAIERKNALGRMEIIEPEKFIEGEMKPHATPGVGYGEYFDKAGKKTNAKIWAGTHIKLPLDEAKHLVAKKIAERADVIAA